MQTLPFHIERNLVFFSKSLNREVLFDIVIPTIKMEGSKFQTLYMNDGQDFDLLEPNLILENHYASFSSPFLWVNIHTNSNRLREYGTSYQPDYKNRGDLATEYMQFIVSEFIPYIQENYPSEIEASKNYFCGFSLGGLSALDIVFENPSLFSKVGVFSGALWWRSKSYENGYVDQDRIMHNKIKNGKFQEGLKFWFECGSNDETADRNNNGIIDSIDDTLDLIQELKNKGYLDVTYLEIDGGEHNFNTWKKIFPNFLRWVLK